MQIETVFDPSKQITTIRCVPDNYDAFPPASIAWLDGRIIEHNKDRAAAAQALLLLPYVSGRLSPIQGCGVEIAGSLRDLFLPRKIILDHVELKPARIPSGTRTVHLCDGSYRSAALLRARRHDVMLRLSESAYTTAISPRQAVISSNFGLFARRDGQLHAILPLIAAALLYAEDLSLARFLVPVQDLTAEERQLFARVTALLAAVNVAVEAPFLQVELPALSKFLPEPAALEMFFFERHEHTSAPEDLPDFWIAILLRARANGDTKTMVAASERLQVLGQAGHQFSQREHCFIQAHLREAGVAKVCLCDKNLAEDSNQ
ncbi:hypothetical protein [Microvirga sp. BSC39]|uniref:hypothetical protein n=1 Tax=Microvirga sp. BSC39 TaxID=1549810 RepID=UPI000AF3721A|nr:hypothetical protein [Microvirga sp. BSC39]